MLALEVVVREPDNFGEYITSAYREVMLKCNFVHSEPATYEITDFYSSKVEAAYWQEMYHVNVRAVYKVISDFLTFDHKLKADTFVELCKQFLDHEDFKALPEGFVDLIQVTGDIVAPGATIGFLKNSVDTSTHLATRANDLPGALVVIDNTDFPCGCQFKTAWNVYQAVVHLNDDHKWTREEIADWLEDLHKSEKLDLAFKVDVD